MTTVQGTACSFHHPPAGAQAAPVLRDRGHKLRSRLVAAASPRRALIKAAGDRFPIGLQSQAREVVLGGRRFRCTGTSGSRSTQLFGVLERLGLLARSTLLLRQLVCLERRRALRVALRDERRPLGMGNARRKRGAPP